MKRKQISYNLNSYNYFIIFLNISSALYLIASLLLGFYSNESLIINICFIFFFTLINFVLLVPRTVEYDSENMYILLEEKTIEVPLKNINTIKLTNASLNDRFIWKIKFSDKLGNKKSIRILPRIWYTNFYEFKDFVEKQNKNLKFQSHSHFLDFDQ